MGETTSKGFVGEAKLGDILVHYRLSPDNKKLEIESENFSGPFKILELTENTLIFEDLNENSQYKFVRKNFVALTNQTLNALTGTWITDSFAPITLKFIKRDEQDPEYRKAKATFPEIKAQGYVIANGVTGYYIKKDDYILEIILDEKINGDNVSSFYFSISEHSKNQITFFDHRRTKFIFLRPLRPYKPSPETLKLLYGVWKPKAECSDDDPDICKPFDILPAKETGTTIKGLMKWGKIKGTYTIQNNQITFFIGKEKQSFVFTIDHLDEFQLVFKSPDIRIALFKNSPLERLQQRIYGTWDPPSFCPSCPQWFFDKCEMLQLSCRGVLLMGDQRNTYEIDTKKLLINSNSKNQSYRYEFLGPNSIKLINQNNNEVSHIFRPISIDDPKLLDLLQGFWQRSTPCQCLDREKCDLFSNYCHGLLVKSATYRNGRIQGKLLYGEIEFDYIISRDFKIQLVPVHKSQITNNIPIFKIVEINDLALRITEEQKKGKKHAYWGNIAFTHYKILNISEYDSAYLVGTWVSSAAKTVKIKVEEKSKDNFFITMEGKEGQISSNDDGSYLEFIYDRHTDFYGITYVNEKSFGMINLLTGAYHIFKKPDQIKFSQNNAKWIQTSWESEEKSSITSIEFDALKKHFSSYTGVANVNGANRIVKIGTDGILEISDDGKNTKKYKILHVDQNSLSIETKAGITNYHPKNFAKSIKKKLAGTWISTDPLLGCSKWTFTAKKDTVEICEIQGPFSIRSDGRLVVSPNISQPTIYDIVSLEKNQMILKDPTYQRKILFNRSN